MVLLQSHDRFNDLAELDLDSGRVVWFSRGSLSADEPIRGHIAQLEERTLCLYREGGMLHLRIDSQDWELDEDTQIDLVPSETNINRISVLRRGVPLFEWDYQRPSIDPPLELDPTPFAEMEDFDFCLFVHNVVRDPERKRRIYTTEPQQGDQVNGARSSL